MILTHVLVAVQNGMNDDSIASGIGRDRTVGARPLQVPLGRS